MDLIVGMIILIAVFLGYKKGFVRTVIRLISFFVAIGLSLMFYKPLATILIENTTIDDWIMENITSSSQEQEVQKVQQSHEDKEQEEIKTASTSSKTDGNMLDWFTNLPAAFTEGMNLEEIKEEGRYELATQISELIMNLLSLMIIYVIVKVTLAIATWILDGIMKIPVLKQLNEILGMGIGVVIGFAQVYIAFAILTFLSSICDISFVIEAIKASAFASILFEHNIIIYLLF